MKVSFSSFLYLILVSFFFPLIKPYIYISPSLILKVRFYFDDAFPFAFPNLLPFLLCYISQVSARLAARVIPMPISLAGLASILISMMLRLFPMVDWNCPARYRLKPLSIRLCIPSPRSPRPDHLSNLRQTPPPPAPPPTFPPNPLFPSSPPKPPPTSPIKPTYPHHPPRARPQPHPHRAT